MSALKTLAGMPSDKKIHMSYLTLGVVAMIIINYSTYDVFKSMFFLFLQVSGFIWFLSGVSINTDAKNKEYISVVMATGIIMIGCSNLVMLTQMHAFDIASPVEFFKGVFGAAVFGISLDLVADIAIVLLSGVAVYINWSIYCAIRELIKYHKDGYTGTSLWESTEVVCKIAISLIYQVCLIYLL